MTKKNKKSEFYENNKAFLIDDVDVNKLLVSKKTIWHKESI